MKTNRLWIVCGIGIGMTVLLVGLFGTRSLPLAQAAPIGVSTTSDGVVGDGECTLREAIIAANTDTAGYGCPEGSGADVIALGAGTYVLDVVGVDENAAHSGDLDVTAPLTITGAGPGQTFIDASGVISDRVFDVRVSGRVVFSGVTVINGNVTGSGGGIFNSGADLVLLNTQVLSSAAGYGGGVYMSSGSLQITGGRIASNTASLLGGGVGVGGGRAALEGVRVISNTAVSGGGGLYISAGRVTADGAQILDNVAAGGSSSGGGVYLSGASTVFTVTGDSLLAYNTAVYGGGVYIGSGRAVLSGSQILSNVASSRGGGVYISLSTGSFEQAGSSLIAYNGAGYGGGLYVWDGIGELSGGVVLSNTANFGGGVYVRLGRAILHGGEIISNSVSSQGGGVYVFDASGVFTQTGSSTIGYNSATGNGGGVYVASGRAALESGQLLSNTSGSYGGGLYVWEGRAVLNGMSVVSNTAIYPGGGVFVFGDGAFTMTNSTLAANVSANNCGGVSNQGSTAILNSVVIGNRGNWGGGACGLGVMTIVNSTFSGNQATNGGALWALGGTTAMTYTTIASNTVGSGAGGIYQTAGTVVLHDVILAYNETSNCSGVVFSNGYNLEDGTTCGLDATGDITATNPLLGPLADNGGDTLTHALLEGSLAIDNGLCQTQLTATDQRGVARPMGVSCDIGAYEVSGWQIYLPLVLRE